MKKITALSLILILFSVVASAQRVIGIRSHPQRFNNGQVTRLEKIQLKRDVVRSNMIQRSVRRDGVVTPLEKRRVHKAKCKTRRDAFRFRHNGRNRVI